MSQFSQTGFTFLLGMLLFATVLLIYQRIKKYQEKKRLFQYTKAKDKKEKKKKENFEFQYFKQLKRRIDKYFKFKTNKSRMKTMYYSILLIELFLFMIFIFNNELLLAVAFPVLFHFFVLKALDIISVNMDNIIAKNFSTALKHITKVLAKTSDLKTVIYEVGKDLDEPLRGKFLDLSRKMISGNQEEALLEFADEIDNVWVYAFVFILMNYKEQSKKEDVEQNLLLLAEMLDKERHIKEQAITDKKFVTVMNYALVILAVIGFVLNMVFNNEAYVFFFESTTGLICFVVGFIALFGTILLNLKMSH